MINYPNSSISISHLRGKLVILDFWNIHCSACIAGFPKMMALQKANPEKLAIITICYSDNRKNVLNFLTRLKQSGRELTLPTYICEGGYREIERLFPSNTPLPMLTWISPEGKILAFTQSTEVNEANIHHMLNGSSASILKQHTIQRDFKSSSPLLVNNNGGPDSAFLYRSLFTGNIDSIFKMPLQKFKTEKGVRLIMQNDLPVHMILRCLYRKGLGDIGSTPYIFEDSSLNYLTTERFCYELTLPPGHSTEEETDYMLQDIQRFFHIKASLEKRKTSSLVLYADSSNIHLLKTKGGKTFSSFTEDKDSFTIRNSPAWVLVNNLHIFKIIPRITDRTGFKGNIDINMKKPASLKELKDALFSYGIIAKEEEVDIDVLMIKKG